jgi:hypothetical protein
MCLHGNSRKMLDNRRKYNTFFNWEHPLIKTGEYVYEAIYYGNMLVNFIVLGQK